MPDLYKSNDSAEGRPERAGRVEGPSSTRALWSYYVNPRNVRFETQDDEEKIVLLLRKHPITNLGWILIALFMLLAPMFFDAYTFLPFLPRGFYFIAGLLWYLVTTAFIMQSFLSWFFNVYILTDERIIDVDFLNLIYREISEAKIDKIQDVTFSMGGLMSTFFNYGNIMIQTAGTVPNFEFIAVPEPASVVKILQVLRNEEEQEFLEGRAI